MAFDFGDIKKHLAPTKTSKKLEDFGDTYSTILLGMHSDINQYKRMVDKVQENITSVEETVFPARDEVKNIQLVVRDDRNFIQEKMKGFDLAYEEVMEVHKNLGITLKKIASLETGLRELNDRLEEQDGQLLHLSRSTEKNSSTALSLSLASEKQFEEMRFFKTWLVIITIVLVLLLFFVIWNF